MENEKERLTNAYLIWLAGTLEYGEFKGKDLYNFATLMAEAFIEGAKSEREHLEKLNLQEFK